MIEEVIVKGQIESSDTVRDLTALDRAAAQARNGIQIE